MKSITAILAFLILLTGCGESSGNKGSLPTLPTRSSAEKDSGEPFVTTASGMTVTTAVTTVMDIQPETAAAQETTAVSTAEPISTAEPAVIPTEAQHTEDTAEVDKPPQTTALSPTLTTVTTTQQVTQTVPPVTTVTVTEPITEPPTEPETVLPNDGTDYGKARAVYEFMRQNGHGTCVNFACQTYELCRNIGLECYLVWTDAGMYGHVANIVKVEGVWYVLDTHGGYFLDYNYCFTEVVDTDGNHVADSEIISSGSYDELH